MPSKRRADSVDADLSETRQSTHPAEMSETAPIVKEMVSAEAETGQVDVKKTRRPWVRWAISIIIGLLAISALSAMGGYRSGLGELRARQELSLVVQILAQYRLGLEDLDAGRYNQARQRFEWVIQQDPNFPGALEKLTQAQIALNSTATPTPLPTAVVSPTPDLRTSEQLFSDAQQYTSAQDWDNVLLALDSLRKNDPNYQLIEVDRMYYLAFRNRGVKRILEIGDLEGGIFDLTQASRFGPLDVEATSYKQWAEWYIAGASFWELDWGEVITYYSYLVPVAPNLHDTDFFYAQDRLATAQVSYAKQLIETAYHLLELKGWCDAWALYQESNGYVPLPPEVVPTAEWAQLKCELNPDEEPRTPVPTP